MGIHGRELCNCGEPTGSTHSTRRWTGSQEDEEADEQSYKLDLFASFREFPSRQPCQQSRIIAFCKSTAWRDSKQWFYGQRQEEVRQS